MLPVFVNIGKCLLSHSALIILRSSTYVNKFWYVLGQLHIYPSQKNNECYLYEVKLPYDPT